MSFKVVASTLLVVALLVVGVWWYWTKYRKPGADTPTPLPPDASTSADSSGADNAPDPNATPEWVNGPTTWDKLAETQHKNNVEYLASKVGSDEGQPLDIVFYGDELVQEMRRGEATAGDNSPWLSVLPAKEYRTALMGVPGVGGSVEGLGWRLITGAERPKKDPKCLVLYTGMHNLVTKDAAPPSDVLKVLLTWLTKSMPRTSIVVLGLVPDSKLGDTIKQTNANYQQIVGEVNKENGNMVSYVDCAAIIDPRNAALFAKSMPSPNEAETHSELHVSFFRCLLTKLKPLLDNSV